MADPLAPVRPFDTICLRCGSTEVTKTAEAWVCRACGAREVRR